MAPIKPKNRTSTSPARSKSPVRTPDRSPIKKPLITQRQKQALIDNLQLEITERARKLRAQYALQAQSLRNRVERRINRIPISLRNAKMGELLEKYTESLKREQEKPKASNALKKAPVKRDPPKAARADIAAPAVKSRGVKRTSADMLGADKENTPDPSIAVPIPKKRTNATTAPGMVLSPKSSNSRTLPQSPIRPPFGSPQKLPVSRPQSPLKPVASPFKAAAAAATSSLANMVSGKGKATTATMATSRKASKTEPKPPISRPKRGAAATATSTGAEQRTVSSASNTSGTSGTSTGTTIVRRVGNALKGTTAAKKTAAAKAAPPKKAAPTKSRAETIKADASTAARRVLRKRA